MLSNLHDGWSPPLNAFQLFAFLNEDNECGHTWDFFAQRLSTSTLCSRYGLVQAITYCSTPFGFRTLWDCAAVIALSETLLNTFRLPHSLGLQERVRLGPLNTFRLPHSLGLTSTPQKGQ